MDEPVFLTFVCALFFALVHLLAGKLTVLEGIPRSRWLSFAGGVSVAYVFLHVLPELSEGQEAVGEIGALEAVSHHVYLVALVGLVLFYGVERAALIDRNHERTSSEATSPAVFWLHVGIYSVYNALVGFLLVHREDPTRFALLWYVAAMGLHFVVNDFGLRDHHKHRYRSRGRWILGSATMVGWGAGMTLSSGPVVTSILFAFLAGGVVLNVLKEELPEERKSRFWAFALGVVLFATILLVPA